jgi:FAD/FMN-containing dehydrogenase
MNDLTHELHEFAKQFEGAVIRPGDQGYDEVSKVFMAQGSPAVVVRPLHAADVALAVSFARARGLELSVRSGGHSGAGHSTNDGGMVIDVRKLDGVEVIDPEANVVRVGAGALWGNVAEALEPHGLAISSGDTKTVGVGGLTLAGGVGWMVRKYGLTIDSLVAAEIVTADGDILRVSQDEESDLFWAIRGGGGNFGVAVSFDIAAHPTGDVYGGMVMYSMDDIKQALTGWRDCMRAAPRELTTMFLVMPATPGFEDMPASCMVLVCYAGDDETEAMHAIDPLLKLGRILNKDIGRKKYKEVLGDAHAPGNRKVLTNNAFMRELSDELIDTICEKPEVILQIRSVGGAMNDVAADATAFAHRDSEVMIVSPAFLAHGSSAEDEAEALAPWRKIAKFGHGAYINFFNYDGPAELEAGYPPATLKRLRAIKKQYDPQNLFHHNYNIKPGE